MHTAQLLKYDKSNSEHKIKNNPGKIIQGDLN